MVGLFNGIAIGSGVIVAKYYGARDIANLQKSIHTTVGFGLICGVILTIVGIIAAPQILVLMGTPEAVLPNSITYFRIYLPAHLPLSCTTSLSAFYSPSVTVPSSDLLNRFFGNEYHS